MVGDETSVGDQAKIDQSPQTDEPLADNQTAPAGQQTEVDQAAASGEPTAAAETQISFSGLQKTCNSAFQAQILDEKSSIGIPNLVMLPNTCSGFLEGNGENSVSDETRETISEIMTAANETIRDIDKNITEKTNAAVKIEEEVGELQKEILETKTKHPILFWLRGIFGGAFSRWINIFGDKSISEETRSALGLGEGKNLSTMSNKELVSLLEHINKKSYQQKQKVELMKEIISFVLNLANSNLMQTQLESAKMGTSKVDDKRRMNVGENLKIALQSCLGISHYESQETNLNNIKLFAKIYGEDLCVRILKGIIATSNNEGEAKESEGLLNSFLEAHPDTQPPA